MKLLCGKRLLLRTIESHDLPLLVVWRNDPDNWPHFFNPFPISLSGQKDWFDNLRKDVSVKFFMLQPHKQKNPVGFIGLTHIDFRNQSAEITSVLIGNPKCRGKGLAKESLDLLMDFAFDHLNLQRLQLEVFADNQAAIRLYRNRGFIEEGRLRRAKFRHGTFSDTLIMAVLRHERAI